MAVRRISDLPNLYSYYDNAALSNGLMEVSYADPKEPRRYVSYYANIGTVFDRELSVLSSYATKDDLSKYVLKSTVQHLSSSIYDNSTWIPDGNAIYDYIKAQNFLTQKDLEDLGIGDIKDFVNQIDAMLNTKPLFLFVAQWGIKYNDIFDSKNMMRYDVIRTTADYKTPIWKYTGDDSLLDDIRTKYYNAHQYDIIFFKTINDAIKFSQRFKFLEGAYIRILICTDLIQPLNCNYTVKDGRVYFNSITSIRQSINHSDNCVVEITGAKINQIDISVNADHDVTRYYINYDSTYRTIYARYRTFVKAPYQTIIRAASQEVHYSFLIFDYGNRNARDADTYTSYGINHLNNSLQGTVDRCAFMHIAGFGVMGSNVSLTTAVFSNCWRGIGVFGGNRSPMNGNLCFLSCDTVFHITEGGLSLRDNAIANSFMYVKGDRMFDISDSGIMNFHAGMAFNNPLNNAVISQYESSRPTAFARLSSTISSGVTVYGISSIVSYDDMSTAYSTYKNSPTLSSQLSTFVPTSYHTVVLATTTDGIVSSDLDTPYVDFTTKFTKLQTPINGQISSYYEGTYNNTGFFSFSYDKLGQSIVTSSKLFDNYEVDISSSTSRLRQWMKLFDMGTRLADIWESRKYRYGYNIIDHSVNYYLSVDNFSTSNNGTSHDIYAYPTFVAKTNYTGNNVAYSFEGIAGVESTNSPLISASIADFESLSAKMSIFSYEFTKSTT